MDPNTILAETLEVAEAGWKEANVALALAVELQEQVDSLQREIAERAKSASATQTTPLDQQRLTNTLQLLTRIPGVKLPDTLEKMASDLRKDPNGFLDLLVRVTQISSTPRPEGRGVTKTAAENDIAGFRRGIPVPRDTHGFHDVILNGVQ